MILIAQSHQARTATALGPWPPSPHLAEDPCWKTNLHRSLVNVSSCLASKAQTALCSRLYVQDYVSGEHPWKIGIVSPKRRHLQSRKQAFLLFSLINIVSLHSSGKAHLMPIIKKKLGFPEFRVSLQGCNPDVCRVLSGSIHKTQYPIGLRVLLLP